MRTAPPPQRVASPVPAQTTTPGVGQPHPPPPVALYACTLSDRFTQVSSRPTPRQAPSDAALRPPLHACVVSRPTPHTPGSERLGGVRSTFVSTLYIRPVNYTLSDHRQPDPPENRNGGEAAKPPRQRDDFPPAGARSIEQAEYGGYASRRVGGRGTFSPTRTSSSVGVCGSTGID